MVRASKSPRDIRKEWAWAQEKGNGPWRPKVLQKKSILGQKGHKAHSIFLKFSKKKNGPK